MRAWMGLAVAATLLAGCMSVGRSYDQAAAAQVRPGMTEQEVVARLGAPYTRTARPDGGYQLLWMHNQADGVFGKSSVQSDSFTFGPDHRVVSVDSSTDIAGRS